MSNEGPLKPKSRWKYIFLISAVVLVTGLWSAYWAAGRGIIADILRNTVEVAQVEGGTLACAEQVLGGFPFRFELTCRPLQIADSEGSRLTVAGFRAVALAYNPKHLIIEADAPLEAVSAKGAPGAVPQVAGLELSAGWQLAHASAKVGESSLARFDAEVETPNIDLLGLGQVVLSLGAEAGEMHVRRVDPNDESVDVALQFKGVTAGSKAPVSGWPPVDANLLLRLPYGAPALAGGALDKVLADILQKPGAIEITDLRLAGGDIEVRAKGTLGVDGDGWLTGDLPMTIVGAENMAVALAPFFPVGSKAPETLQGAVLGFGKKTTLEEKPAVTVTVTFERGRARLGLIPVANLPKVL